MHIIKLPQTERKYWQNTSEYGIINMWGDKNGILVKEELDSCFKKEELKGLLK